MLGSHDSYTYQRANNPLLNKIKRYWRTQTKSIDEQYEAGVRFFDIRVKRNVVWIGNKVYIFWQTCHGLAEFDETFHDIPAICKYFDDKYKGSIYRIWLEKGTESDEEVFKNQIDCCARFCPNLMQAVIKKGEIEIYRSVNHPKLNYYPYKDWTVKGIVKNLFKCPIKDWAKKHNPKITKEILDSDEIYFIDYV